MYNPSRGGVRGGADQFTWESVKTDKHRENYLGHSLMAPVGRWQKGKDLTWYSKDRKDAEAQEKANRNEFASVKRAEEEAMLIALGHNIVRKENHQLTKEEMREALKRNAGERDAFNVERVDGVGASGSSKRLALLANAGSNFKPKQEGVAFEGSKSKTVKNSDDSEQIKESHEKRKKSKKSKKHKKDEKYEKQRKESTESDSPEPTYKSKPKYRTNTDCEKRISHRDKSHKKSKHKHRNYSSDDSAKYKSCHRRKSEKQNDYKNVKRQRHDSSESD